MTVSRQIDKFIHEDIEFVTEIPLPDTHKNFESIKRSGKDNIEFEHSIVYNKIVGVKEPKPDKSVLKFDIDKQIRKKMKERVNPFWW